MARSLLVTTPSQSRSPDPVAQPERMSAMSPLSTTASPFRSAGQLLKAIECSYPASIAAIVGGPTGAAS